MKNAAWILAFRVLVAVTRTGSSSEETRSEETADCGSAPTRSLPSFTCTISPKSNRSCSFEDTDQGAVSAYDDGPCYAWTGMQLNVSCDGGDSQIFFRGNSTLSGQFILWPFASTSAEGLYECRSDNGSLVANRSVIIDDGVYVTPGNTQYYQWCIRNIVPGYKCSVPDQPYQTPYEHDHEPHKVLFNVVGARPIDVSVEVIWVNHYPVDLDLSWEPTANTHTTLHSVTLNMRELVMMGENKISFYVVISANSSYGSSTMCALHHINGDPVLFSDENSPSDLTVVEHQSANFSCQAQTLDNNYAFTYNTVAFLVRSPDSSELTECLNCSFSMTELTMCREMVDEGSCSGLQFVNSSFGHPDVLTHNLTAHWSEVDMRHSGYEVVCAIAVSGITQWAHTATLTVTPATPTPTPTSVNDGKFLQERDIVLLTSGVVVLGSITGASVVGLILLYRHKRRHTYWSPASTHEDKTFVKFEKVCG